MSNFMEMSMCHIQCGSISIALYILQYPLCDAHCMSRSFECDVDGLINRILMIMITNSTESIERSKAIESIARNGHYGIPKETISI